MANKNKEKKQKIRYVDDGSTVVDMQPLQDSRRRPGEKPRDPGAKGTLREQFRTYFAAVKLMFWPMMVTLGIIFVSFLVTWIFFTLAR
ncbi:MAG: hypothetical protein E7581_02660 [Ruminococcaceae bacterium]|nr:hypothetical protein [Oscillospiraceae bacterium]